MRLDTLFPTCTRVAPHAGAWIEIAVVSDGGFGARVAPHAGAWIEIVKSSSLLKAIIVAPHAGAWIEIFVIYCSFFRFLSHPMRVRGLKCAQVRPSYACI